jgi:hypothetical protein
MKELLEYLARQLVDDPDAVGVEQFDEEDGTVVLEISSEVHVRFARAAIARVLTPAPTEQTTAPAADDVDSDPDGDVQADKIIERRD